jgi:hypothetical protein
MKIKIERETLQSALDALDHLGDCSDRDVSPEEWNVAQAEQACDAMRRALAQPAQCQICNGDDMQAPCAHPSEGLSGCLRVAAAEVLAERERCAKVCDDHTPSVDDYSDQRDFAIRGVLRDVVAAIRNGG